MLVTEMEKLMADTPMGLDVKSREAFTPKFNQLKNFLIEFNI